MSMWRLILAGIILLPWSAVAQQRVLPVSVGSLANYQIPTCARLGCDRQVVEPKAVLSKYSDQYGSEGKWRKRVDSHKNYDKNACSSSVKELFNFACGDSQDCEIEDSYDNKCLSRSTNIATLKRCVAVVGNYVSKCFGGCPRRLNNISLDGIIGSKLMNDRNDEPFCSGTGFNLGTIQNPSPVIVTAPHCQKDVQPGKTMVIGEYPSSGENPVILNSVDQIKRQNINPKLLVYDVRRPSQGTRYPLKYMRPVRFAKTVFQGYNRLIASRNKILETVEVHGESKYNPLHCDSSPLCTIIHIDNGKILHTCQSSKGGSGGALYQIVRDRIGIVAVNKGARKSGQVTENEGIALRRP